MHEPSPNSYNLLTRSADSVGCRILALLHSFGTKKNLPIQLTCLALLAFYGATAAFAQYTSPSAAVTSLTGQFISRDQRVRGPSQVALKYSTNNQFVCLDSALVSVSCERIKVHLKERLQTTAPWRGKVFIAIHPADSADEPIGIVSERFQDVWQYRLDLPDVTDRARYVRSVVQVLLLEIANRSNPPRSAELPLWLLEGFTRQLLASSELEIVLQPPGRKANGLAISDTFYESRRSTTFASQRDDPLAFARTVLRSNAYFNYDRLSWPMSDQLSGQEREVFSSSSQLFVTELLRISDGKAAMLSFLGQLPSYYNWQLAFLSAFHKPFNRPLDVEKWWNLRWLDFTGTDANHTWLATESWSQLEQALRAPMETRTETNQLPQHFEASLQTLISKWDADSKADTLKAKLRELELLQLRVDPWVALFLDGYKRVLEAFLKDSNPSGITALVRKKAAIENARSQAIAQLELLDARRRAAAAQAETVAASDKSRSPREGLRK